MIANTLSPPYYAVIFSSTLQEDADLQAYGATAEKLEQLALQQPGYLGIESARNELGITISYWKDLASIKSWKENADHQWAQKMGKAQWYDQFKVRIAKVEREYSIK